MLKNCRNRDCAKLFSTTNADTKFCPKCDEKNEMTEDQAYQIIKDYLVNAPNATVKELKENTEVHLDMITSLYQSGRFTLVNVPHCSRCGTAMVDGKPNATFCKSCSDYLSREIGQPQNQSQAATQQQSSKSNRSYGIGSR